MSEYTYFQGKIRPKSENLSTCFEVLFKSEFLKGIEESLSKDSDYITIDTIDKTDADTVSRDSFMEALESCLPYLKEEAELDYFRWGEGYFKLKLTPNSQKIELIKISDFDPNGKNITEEELYIKLGNKNAEDVIKKFYQLVKQTLLEGKTVQTDLGVFYALNKVKSAKEVRNPQTGEATKIPEKSLKIISLKGNSI